MSRVKAKTLVAERDTVDLDDWEEINIITDYLQTAGLSFQNDIWFESGSATPNQTTGVAAGIGSVYLQDNGNIWLKIGIADIDWFKLPKTASELPFDNSTNGFTSSDVQGAIEEIGASASPGYSFGRAGNLPSGTWLNRPGGVPSNKSGITLFINNPEIIKIACSTEKLNTYDLTIYEHDGDELNLTTLGIISVVNVRSKITSVNYTATTGKQLAIKISSGSAKNLGVDLQLKGNS